MRILSVLLLFLPLTAAAEEAPRVAVSAADCRQLLQGAAYVAGVDADGNPVAAADLPASSPPADAVSPDTISIEIDPTLAGQYGIPASGAGAYGTRPILGFVTVQDRKAYLNGKPLAPAAQDALAAACRAATPK